MKRPTQLTGSIGQEAGISQIYAIAYIDFASQADAEKALQALNGH